MFSQAARTRQNQPVADNYLAISGDALVDERFNVFLPLEGTELFILGAGCSVASGYPTAAGMLAALTAFPAKLNNKNDRIRGCVDRP